MKASIDLRKCPAQEVICEPIQVCPQGALVYVQDERVPLGGKIVVDADQCDGCGLCVQVCCGAAIQIQ